MAHFPYWHAWEAANFLHNTLLDEPADLSPEYFFARLARTVIPHTENVGVKQCRSPSATSSLDVQPKSRRKRGTPVAPPLDIEMAQLGDSSGPIDEARELAEDNQTAIRIYPHVFGSHLSGSGLDDDLELLQPIEDPDSVCKTRAIILYHELKWYPGHRRVERLKKAYMDANPQVAATSKDNDAGSSDTAGTTSVVVGASVEAAQEDQVSNLAQGLTL